MDLLNERNEKSHHTDQFQTKDLVIRRGQPFFIDVHLREDYNKDEHDFQIVLKTGRQPRQSDRSKVVARLADNIDKTQWSMVQVGTTLKRLQMKISVPADAIVSKYTLSIESAGRVVHENEHKIFLLFNPWVQGLLTF